MAEKKSILTLNIGSQRVGMARFSVGARNALLLREYAFEEIPADVASDGVRKSLTTGALKNLVGRLKGQGQDVNYAASAQTPNTITRFVKLPSLGEDQVDKIVGFEAQQAVPFPLSETVWDYQIMGKAGEDVEVAIVAIRSEQVEELNSVVQGGGLAPKIVDAAPLALYNAFRYNHGTPDHCVLLVDMGSRTTNCIYIEGARVFVASFGNAGFHVTSAIAKEMDADFQTAEERKKEAGFVNLGGNYADHDDPEVDAMSKIIRNQFTRLHAEINRRNQQWKSQGGSPPAEIYLAGGAAALPYTKEFFEEKFRVPVHWFNALANVSVGPKINVDQAGREAHTLGELVGLALREMSCPLELDLSPRSVSAARDVSSKKPVLLTAAACLFAGLGAWYVYLNQATSAKRGDFEKVEKEFNELDGVDRQIRAETDRQSKEEARFSHLNNAIAGRQYWLTVLNALNSQFSDDSMWFTYVGPLDAEGKLILKPLGGAEGPAVPAEYRNESAKPAGGAAGAQELSTVDALFISGLYQTNKVRELFLKYKDLKDFFEIPDDWVQNENKWFTVDTGKESSEWASAFTMRLPLKNKLKVHTPPALGSGGTR